MTVPTSSPQRGLSFVAAGLAAALSLAGCATPAGLVPAGTPLEGDRLQAGASLAGAPAATFPRHDWWTALGDPQLDALVAEALAGNPGLAAADARARLAQAQAGLADAARQPTLSASARVSAAQLPETVVDAPMGGEVRASGLLMLQFAWAPDLWGGQRARWEAAVGQARAAEVDAEAARITLSANVARAYVGLARAWAAGEVAGQEQARAGTLLALARQRVAAGLDTTVQLRQAERLVAAAAQQREAAGQEVAAARNALAALLGQGPDRGLAIAPPRLLAAPSPAVPAVLPSELLGHRADVVAARWRVEAAACGIDAARADFRPSVNLSALAGLAGGGLSDLFSSDAVLGLGGPALSLPIFDGGRLRAGLAGRNADYDLAVAGYNESLVAALREVTDALQAARSLDRQLASAGQARDAAQDAFDLALSRHRAGLSTQLDVLAAQAPLLDAEQQLTALHARRYLATIDLDQALGGGYVPGEPARPSHGATKGTTP